MDDPVLQLPDYTKPFEVHMDASRLPLCCQGSTHA